MNYFQGDELKRLMNCFIGKDPIKVKVAIHKMVDFLSKIEKSIQEEFPDFLMSKAFKFVCGDINQIVPLPQSDYLAQFEGLDIPNLIARVKNAINAAFDQKWFDFYTEVDLPRM